MEKEMKYEAPVVDVLEVEVEKGFAASVPSDSDGEFGEGGNEA